MVRQGPTGKRLCSELRQGAPTSLTRSRFRRIPMGEMPHRKRYLFVCTNRRDEGNPKGSCAQKGSEEVAKRLKEVIKTKGLASEIRACTVSCLDLCEIGISVVQEPDHVAYGGVTLDDVEELADACGRGEVVERLVVHRGGRTAGEG
jgi:(2Fe-2S) ferredoxin